MSDPNQPGVEPPHTNGITELDEDEKNKIRPADIDADMREMERRKRVEMIMNSKLFREELERILDGQFKEGGGPSGLLQQISDMMGIPASRVAGNVFKSSNCVVPINDIRGVESMGYGKGEKILRCKLAAVFRLMDLYGWTQGINSQITARINADQELFLVNPFGMLYHEVTASSLVKVDMQASIVEQGTTNFGVNIGGFMLHSAIHAARPDIRCVIHVHCAPVVAVSALKCGLLPLSRDSVLVGEIAQHQYFGGFGGPEEREKLSRSLGPISKVLFLSNHGAVCCGETIEEAFYTVYHTVLACEAQLKLMPLGIDNLSLIPDEVRKAIYDSSRRAPENAAESKHVKWRVGGVEYEALMRMLDNAGFRTGYIYRNPLVKGDVPRPKNDVEVPPAVSSLGYLLEEEELYKQGLWKKLDGRKGHDRTRWLNSPNVYQKVEILETGTPDPKKITKWVDSNAEEWVADGSPTHSSTPVRIESALQFVPKNTNPKEFKQVQQQIKDYRRADKISAGPQSHILEGVTWEEARRLQDAGESHTGDHVVLLGAASKGIIQRGFQHNATVYKAPYAKNPFDAVTDDELNEYKKTVERKAKGEYDTDFSESEALSSMHISSTRHEDITPTGVMKSPVMSPQSVASETEEESRDEPQILRIETRHAPKPSQPEVVLSDATTDFLTVERSQAARFTQKEGVIEVLHEIQRPILKVPVKYVEMRGTGTEICVYNSASLSSSQDSSPLNTYKVQGQFSQDNIENYNPNIIVNGGTFSGQNYRYSSILKTRTFFEPKDYYTTRYYSGFVPPKKFPTPYHFHIANLTPPSKLKSIQNQNNYFCNDFGKITEIAKSTSLSGSKDDEKSLDSLATETSSVIFLNRNTMSSLDKDIQTDILKLNLQTADSETQTDILNYISNKFMDAGIQTDISNRREILHYFTDRFVNDEDLVALNYIARLFEESDPIASNLENLTILNEISQNGSSTENDINNEIEILMKIDLSSPVNTGNSVPDQNSSIHSLNSASDFDKLVAKSVLNSILSEAVAELQDKEKKLFNNSSDNNQIVSMEVETSDYFEDYVQNDTVKVNDNSNENSGNCDEKNNNYKIFDFFAENDSEEYKENSCFYEDSKHFIQVEANNNILRDKCFPANIQPSKFDTCSYSDKSDKDFSKDSLENFNNSFHYMDAESFNQSLCDTSGSGDILNNAFAVLSEHSESIEMSGSGDYHSFSEEYIDDDIFKSNLKGDKITEEERNSPCEDLYKKDVRSYLEPHTLYTDIQDEVTDFVGELVDNISNNTKEIYQQKRQLSTIYEENSESMINFSESTEPIVTSSDSNYCTSSSSGYVDKSETSIVQNIIENEFKSESNIGSEDEFSLLIYDEFLNILVYDLQKDTPKPSIYDSLKNKNILAKSPERDTSRNKGIKESEHSQIINQTVTFVTFDTTDESRIPETTVSSSVAEFEAYEAVIDIIEDLEIQFNKELDQQVEIFRTIPESENTEDVNVLMEDSFAELDKNISVTLLSEFSPNIDLSNITYQSCKFGNYKYIESEDEAKLISREIISDICKEQDKIFAKTLKQDLKRVKPKTHNKSILTGELNKSKSLKEKKPVRRRIHSPHAPSATKNKTPNSSHSIDVSKSNVNTFISQTSNSGTSAKLWVTFSPVVLDDSPPVLDIDKLDNKYFKSPRSSPTWIPLNLNNQRKSPSKKLVNSYVKGDHVPKAIKKDKSKVKYTSFLKNYKAHSTEDIERFVKESAKILEPLREEPRRVLTFSDCEETEEDGDDFPHQLSEDSVSKGLSGTNSEKIHHQVELIEDYTKIIGDVTSEIRENIQSMIEEDRLLLQHNNSSSDSISSNVANTEKSSYVSCGDDLTFDNSIDLTTDSTNDSLEINEF